MRDEICIRAVPPYAKRLFAEVQTAIAAAK